MLKNKTLVMATLIVAVLFASCKKNDVPGPPPLAEFSTYDNQEALHVFSDDEQVPFKLPVGLTQKSDKDITVNFTITSKTGAVEGSQYSINHSQSITIKAGTVSDTLRISGIFAGYTENRIDTLVFTLTGGDVALADGNTSFTLVLRRYCPFVLSNLLGLYRNVQEMLDGEFIFDPYECEVTEVYPGTWGKIDTLSISNFWTSGVAAKVIVNWNDPFMVTTTLLPSYLFTDETYGVVLGLNRKDGQVIVCDGIIGINISASIDYNGTPYILPDAYSTVLRR